MQFADLALRFLCSTLTKLVTLNDLSEAQAASITEIATDIFKTHEGMVKKFGGRKDAVEAMVKKIKADNRKEMNVRKMVASVFALWSVASVSQHSKLLRKPLPAQVVAIIRLLGLDQEQSGFAAFVASGRELLLGKEAIRAHHLAQIKTGQGKSVVLGVLATTLAVCGMTSVIELALLSAAFCSPPTSP